MQYNKDNKWKRRKFFVLPNSDHVTCHEAEERESSFELSLKSVCEQNFRPFRKSEIVSQSVMSNFLQPHGL